MPKLKKKPESEIEIRRAIDGFQIPLELDVIDKQILNLISQNMMITCREIADKIGMSFTSVSKRMKKPKFMQAYEEITYTTAQIMEKNAKKAARRIGEFIEDDEKKIAMEACKIALSPYLNQHSHTVTQQNVVVYKTTVQSDGSLLQSVIEADTVENSP